jgi:hypothetical protein
MDIDRDPLNLEELAKVLPALEPRPVPRKRNRSEAFSPEGPSQTVQARNLKPPRKKKLSVAFRPQPEESKELRAQLVDLLNNSPMLQGPLGRALSQIDGLDLPQETRDRQPKKKTRTLNPFDTMSPEDRAEDEALEDLFHLATNLNRDASEAQRGILERLCEDVNNRLCDLRKSWLSQH